MQLTATAWFDGARGASHHCQQGGADMFLQAVGLADNGRRRRDGAAKGEKCRQNVGVVASEVKDPFGPGSQHSSGIFVAARIGLLEKVKLRFVIGMTAVKRQFVRKYRGNLQCINRVTAIPRAPVDQPADEFGLTDIASGAADYEQVMYGIVWLLVHEDQPGGRLLSLGHLGKWPFCPISALNENI